MALSKGVLLIGLDGGTWKIIKPLMAEGKLPNLATICRESASGILLSTVPAMTCPALPSLFTGRNPGNLGVFTMLNASGSPVLMNSYSYPKLWDVVSNSGGKSAIIDVRFTYPPPSTNGVVISGFPLPLNAENFYYPSNFHEHLGEQIVPLELNHHIKICKIQDFEKEKEKVLKTTKEYVEQRYELIKKITSKDRYDFVFTWFGDLDTIQHIYWQDKDTLTEHLKVIDQSIGRFVGDFKDWNIIIMSDHGFHNIPQKRFFINTWLAMENFLIKKGNRLSVFLSEKTVYLYRLLMKNSIFKKMIAKWQGAGSEIGKNSKVLNDIYYGKFPGIDWKKTKAYLFIEWGVRILKENLNEDYEVFRERLIGKMLVLKDQEGNHVFSKVMKREEVYKGKFLSQIPDIICLFNENYFPDPLIKSDNSLYGEYYANDEFKMTGKHEFEREGIFIGYGPGFVKGRDIGTASIEDIAPTIYQLLGCPMPKDMDGKILYDALSEEFKNLKVEYYTADAPSGDDQKSISNEDENEIKKQLKDMGYLSD